MAADLPPAPEGPSRRFLAVAPLARALGIASDPKKLILAAVGLVAMTVGWWAIDGAYDGPIGRSLRPDGVDPPATLNALDGPGGEWAWSLARRIAEPARVVIGPFANLFNRGIGARDWSRSTLKGLWALVVWGIAGGAIARIAVVRVAGGPGVGLTSAARFALARSLALIGAPLTPVVALAFFAAGCAWFGLLYRLPGAIGTGLGTLLGFLPLVAGLVMALILAGLALGWPLMIVTVAAEGEDAPDALSRSYSYVNQRLARYAAHLAIAWAIGTAGLLLAILFARLVLGLSGWGVGLGAPDDPDAIRAVADSRAIWVALVGWLVHGWIYSYFWSAASILYLILRRDVDGTEWHDVYLPQHDADAFAPEPEAKVAEAEVG